MEAGIAAVYLKRLVRLTEVEILGAFLIVNIAIEGVWRIVLHGQLVIPRQPTPTPGKWTGDTSRKRNAKRVNEHIKLAATLMNNASLAGVITGVLAPFTAGSVKFGWEWYTFVLAAALALLIFAHATLRLWQSEE